MGPFRPERLIEMVKQGKLSRVHMLSTDNDHWQKASEFPDLFQAAARHKPQADDELNQVSTGDQKEASSAIANQSGQPAAGSEEGWHYGINNESFGPVSQAKIFELIGLGQLAENDLVWREGMAEWLKAGTMPVFRSLLISSTTTDPRIVNVDQDRSGSNVDLSEVISVFKAQLPWVTFIGINAYMVAVVYFFSFIAGLVRGGRESDPVLITSGLVCLVYTVLIGLAAFYFQKYGACSRRFSISNDMSDLIESANWLRRVWQLIGYMLIVLWIAVVSAVIYAFTLSQAF